LIPHQDDVLDWAEQIMIGLGTDVPYAIQLEPAAYGPGFVVWLDIAGSGVGVVFDLDESPAQAVARLADGFQDHVLEATHGVPSPRCPGHPHPAVADVIAGTAVWRCMDDPAHFTQPILP
jgi:hypothetical protein